MNLRNHDAPVRFLLWPERQERRLRWLGDFPPNGQLVVRFAEYLSAWYRGFSREDIGVLVHTVVRPHTALSQWYGQVLDNPRIAIGFHDGAPRIPQQQLTAWRTVTTHVDCDALIALAFVRQFNRLPTPVDLSGWGVYITSDDPDLQRLFKRGMKDIHLHMEGCEPVPYLWLLLMQKEVPISAFPEYANLERPEIRLYKQTMAPLHAERDRVIQAIEQRKRLRDALKLPPNFAKVENADCFPSPVSQALWEERLLLAKSWLCLQNNPVEHKVATLLDQYLFAKNAFLARHVQSPGKLTGLQEFRNYYKRAKLLKSTATPSLQWKRLSRLIYFVSESPYLKHIEFRISPFDTPSEYAFFFSKWKKFAAGDPFLKRRGISVSFVIHFIRQPHLQEDDKSRVPLHKLRITLDRQSAALHLFRQKHPELAKLIVGIDVANLERSCPPHIFTPYIKLLRGMPINIIPSPYLRHWQALCRNEKHVLPPNMPRLGLTFHAGEDYYHIVDGLRTMDDAMTGLEMRPGDRIGHGLAAGRSAKDFDRHYGNALHLPAGDALDNMVWLYDQLSHLSGNWERELRELNGEIITLSEALYGRLCLPAHLLRVMARRHEVPPFRSPGRAKEDGQAERILNMDLYDLDVRRRQRTLRPNPDLFRKLPEAVHAVQDALMRKIAQWGVVIEFNPSSNFITGGMEQLAHHPYFEYRKVLGSKLRATINCDDPGTFGTRIENEFACMFNALQDNNYEREEIIAMLEEMRQSAHDFAF